MSEEQLNEQFNQHILEQEKNSEDQDSRVRYFTEDHRVFYSDYEMVEMTEEEMAAMRKEAEEEERQYQQYRDSGSFKSRDSGN